MLNAFQVKHSIGLGLLGCALAAWLSGGCAREAAVSDGAREEGTRARESASTASGDLPSNVCDAKDRAITATTGQVVLNANTLVDAYDSGLGGYGGTNVLSEGTVQAGTQIVKNGGVIHGTEVPNTPLTLTPVTAPSGAIPLPLGATSPGDLNINGPSSNVTLPPGTYVVNNLNLSFSGRLDAAPGGKVEIFVTGFMNLGGIVNQGGSPKNLTFLSPSTGYINVNTNGPLYGSIYAPGAIVQLNSPVFGSVVGRRVVLNSGSAVHYDRALHCTPNSQPPIATRPPRTLPPPPTTNGCYLGTANGWKQVDCTDENLITTEFPVPEPAIESYANTVSSPILLQYGEVDITFSSIANVTDGSGNKDEFSFQANTNQFPRAGGINGWVQFVIQTKRTVDPTVATRTAICIWDFLDTAPPYDYRTSCVGDLSGGSGSPFDPYFVYRRPGSFRQFDFGTVGGSVFVSGGQPKIGLVAQISWFDPNNDPDDDRGLYAVVKDDESGLASGWYAVGGGVYGDGNGTYAFFDDTMVVNRILAGSCANATGPVPEVPWPGACPTQSPLLDNARINETLVDTGEGHNLSVLGGPLTLNSYSPDLVYTQFLTSDGNTCLEGTKRIYVKDHPSDNGFVPSNINGQPFWLSPDLFIVPTGAQVSLDAPTPPIVVSPGQMYDAYMRVNNDYSCEDITGVKVRMHIADPAALSTVWAPITAGTDYVAPSGAPSGVTVPAGGRALVGPFTFQAPATGLGDGHRCVLGSLISDEQSPPTDPFDAPNSHQVAQRNLSFDQCSYPLTNATTSTTAVYLTLSADGALPSLTGDNNFSWKFADPTHDWYDRWVGGAGTTYSVTHSAGETTVRLGPPDGTIWMGLTTVTLPYVPVPAGVTVAATGEVGLAPGAPDTTLSIQAEMYYLEGPRIVLNGGSCVGLAPAPPNCGDGTLDSDEECDDGNLEAGDGCDARCDVEPFCGDGMVDPGEACDDANANNTDGCLDNCMVPSGTGPFYEDSGFIVMEAEHHSALRTDLTTGDVWSQTNLAGASGGQCMTVGPDSTTQFHTDQADAQTNAARMDYPVYFNTAGAWTVWVRGASPAAQAYAGNSCHAGMDGTITALNLSYSENAALEWRSGPLNVAAAGEHTINVFMREDGFRADKIVLTLDSSYTPTGNGPDESPRL